MLSADKGGRLALPPTGAHCEAEDTRFMINWDPGKQLHDKMNSSGTGLLAALSGILNMIYFV